MFLGLVAALMLVAGNSKGEESAPQYLASAMRDLSYLQGKQTLRHVDRQPVQKMVPEPPVADRKVSNGVPPLSLTKGELTALYESAVQKGETVQLKGPDNTPVQAVVTQLGKDKKNDDSSGYYYYYYPIKSFLEDMTADPTIQQFSFAKPLADKGSHQYHTHTHHVQISSNKDMADKKDKKGLEPLFMAISGFIGMAVMFVLSMIILPKFGINKPKFSLKKNERISDIAKVALQAIEGKDCAERFACEFEKTARTFNVQDNRFIKLLKRMAPSAFGKQLDRVRKYSTKELRCRAIPCKKKNYAKKKPKAGGQKIS